MSVFRAVIASPVLTTGRGNRPRLEDDYGFLLDNWNDVTASYQAALVEAGRPNDWAVECFAADSAVLDGIVANSVYARLSENEEWGVEV